MNLTDDEILKFQKGTPILLDDICAIYPARVGEIVDEGYSNFQKYLGLIMIEKPSTLDMDNELKELLKNITDFQYLLFLTAMDAEVNEFVRKAFYFFIHDSISFSYDPSQIIIGPLEEKHILTEEKFYELQSIIKHMYFVETDVEEIIISPNDPPNVRRLKEQMRANRNKLRKAKAKKAARESTDLKFSDLIGSITINDCNLNIENVWNITYYAFHDQLRRMGWRDQFNINNRAALAGAKLNKSQLKHWMRSISNSDKS